MLGETADPLELFMADDCEDSSLDVTLYKINVSRRDTLKSKPINRYRLNIFVYTKTLRMQYAHTFLISDHL